MTELIITGSLENISDSLNNIKAVISDRKSMGWELLHPSEQWLYIAYPGKGNVCPLCESHNGRIFSGDEIVAEFPYYEYIGELIILPHTHMPDLSAFRNEPCHCEMHLQNLAESIEERLHEEKLEVI